MAKLSQAQVLKDWALKHPEAAERCGCSLAVSKLWPLNGFGEVCGEMSDRLNAVKEASRDLLDDSIILSTADGDTEKITAAALHSAADVRQLFITAGSCLAARAAIRRGFVR